MTSVAINVAKYGMAKSALFGSFRKSVNQVQRLRGSLEYTT